MQRSPTGSPLPEARLVLHDRTHLRNTHCTAQTAVRRRAKASLVGPTRTLAIDCCSGSGRSTSASVPSSHPTASCASDAKATGTPDATHEERSHVARRMATLLGKPPAPSPSPMAQRPRAHARMLRRGRAAREHHARDGWAAPLDRGRVPAAPTGSRGTAVCRPTGAANAVD